jgi:hypothetical protein
MECPPYIDFVIFERTGYTFFNRNQGSKVEDCIRAKLADRLAQKGEIEEIPHNELAGDNELLFSRGEIVVDEELMPLSGKELYKVGAYIACTACDEDAHWGFSSRNLVKENFNAQ